MTLFSKAEHTISALQMLTGSLNYLYNITSGYEVVVHFLRSRGASTERGYEKIRLVCLSVALFNKIQSGLPFLSFKVMWGKEKVRSWGVGGGVARGFPPRSGFKTNCSQLAIGLDW